MNEKPQAPSDQPMNRAERRHMAKHGASTEKLRDFRAKQAGQTHHGLGPIPSPMKRGAVHRKTGQ